MRLEAEKFAKILSHLQGICTTLGYEDIKFLYWLEKEDGNMEFVLEDGKSNQRLSFILPVKKEATNERN